MKRSERQAPLHSGLSPGIQFQTVPEGQRAVAAWYAGMGNVWPLGLPVTQSWLELGAILTTIQQYSVSLVVEIGVDQGGLAALLAMRARLSLVGFHYLGFELTPHRVDQRAKDLMTPPHANIFYQDCFTQTTLDTVWLNVQAAVGPALVYCDGGNKPAEWRTFWPLLRVGDLIAAHDYAVEILEQDLLGVGETLERLTPDWLVSTTIVLARRVK